MATTESTNQVELPITSKSESLKREFHDDPGSAYILPGFLDRLLLQHRLIVDFAFAGSYLDDSVKLESGQAVLESGTGSGLWTLEVASKVPSDITFHGIDISNRLFPTNPPSNVTFSKNSILSVPEEWAGKFDIVNQRLLILALREPEWRQAIAGMFEVLKPGGHVQLVECREGFVVGPVSERLWALLDYVFEKRGLDMRVGYKIPGWLEEAGFVDINLDERLVTYGATAGKTGLEWLESCMHFLRACKPAVLETDGLDWKGTDHDKEYDEMLAIAEKEWKESPDFVMVVKRCKIDLKCQMDYCGAWNKVNVRACAA